MSLRLLGLFTAATAEVRGGPRRTAVGRQVPAVSATVSACDLALSYSHQFDLDLMAIVDVLDYAF